MIIIIIIIIIIISNSGYKSWSRSRRRSGSGSGSGSSSSSYYCCKWQKEPTILISRHQKLCAGFTGTFNSVTVSSVVK